MRCRRLPTGEPLVLRLSPFKRDEIARKFGVQFTIDPISGANSDFINRVEHIELRHCHSSESIDSSRIANDYAIEPTAPSRSSRRSAELISQFADSRCKRLIKL